MTNKFDVIALDANTSLFSVHQEHRCVYGQFKLRARANERTANWLPAAFVPGKLKCYQPWRRLHLFSLFETYRSVQYTFHNSDQTVISLAEKSHARNRFP